MKPEPSYQKIEIPAVGDWSVTYSEFYDLGGKSLDELSEDDDAIWNLNEDILQIENTPARLLIDLGFYPSHDPSEGSYRLRIIRGTNVPGRDAEYRDGNFRPEDWQRPLAEFQSRSIEEICNKVQEFMRTEW